MSRTLRLSPEEFKRLQELRQKQAAAAAPGSDDKIGRRNKYGAKRVGEFDSLKEKRRYDQLCILQTAGSVRHLRHHVTFPIRVGAVDIGAYEADFVYEQLQPDGAWTLVVEDAKGYRRGVAYDLFRWKARLMLAVHRIDVREV